MKPLTVRGSHQTCINAYTCITWGKLYINQKQLPRNWSWYDDITNKFDLGRRLNKMELTILDNCNWSLQKGLVLNNKLDCFGLCCSFYDLTPSYYLSCTHDLIHYLYMYLPVSTSWCALLGIFYLDAFQVPRASSHSLDIYLLRFTPDTQTLLLLPPNQ